MHIYENIWVLRSSFNEDDAYMCKLLGIYAAEADAYIRKLLGLYEAVLLKMMHTCICRNFWVIMQQFY